MVRVRDGSRVREGVVVRVLGKGKGMGRSRKG